MEGMICKKIYYTHIIKIMLILSQLYMNFMGIVESDAHLHPSSPDISEESFVTVVANLHNFIYHSLDFIV